MVPENLLDGAMRVEPAAVVERPRRSGSHRSDEAGERDQLLDHRPLCSGDACAPPIA
jgi:hypothetical protein